MSDLSPFNKAVLCLGSTFKILSKRRETLYLRICLNSPRKAKGVPVVFANVATNAAHRVGQAEIAATLPGHLGTY